MYLTSDLLMLLNIVRKNTDKLYEEFVLDLRHYFSTANLVMDLILKLSHEKLGVITDVDQHLFLEKSMQGGYVFHGDRIMGTAATGQRTGEKSNMLYLDMDSLYPSAISHLRLPHRNNKWLENPSASNFPDVSSVKEN